MSLNYTFCHSQNCVILNGLSVNTYVSPPSKQNRCCLALWHTCWSLTVGIAATDLPIPFSQPRSLFLHPCLAPALLYHHLCLLISAFLPRPMVSVQTALSCPLFSRLSLPSLSLAWVTICSGLPQTSSRVQRSRGETSWRKPPWTAPD